jgi:hypothetical protein
MDTTQTRSPLPWLLRLNKAISDRDDGLVTRLLDEELLGVPDADLTEPTVVEAALHLMAFRVHSTMIKRQLVNGANDLVTTTSVQFQLSDQTSSTSPSTVAAVQPPASRVIVPVSAPVAPNPPVQLILASPALARSVSSIHQPTPSQYGVFLMESNASGGLVVQSAVTVRKGEYSTQCAVIIVSDGIKNMDSESLIFDFSCLGFAHGKNCYTSAVVCGKPMQIHKPTGRAVVAVELRNHWLRKCNSIIIRAHISHGRNVTMVQSSHIHVAVGRLPVPVYSQTQGSANSCRQPSVLAPRRRMDHPYMDVKNLYN